MFKTGNYEQKLSSQISIFKLFRCNLQNLHFNTMSIMELGGYLYPVDALCIN